MALKELEKNLGINLTKHVQDLYAENYKMVMEEIKEDLSKQRHTSSWIRRLGRVETSVLSKLIYRFNAIKITAGFIR